MNKSKMKAKLSSKTIKRVPYVIQDNQWQK